ncbi:methylmalonyl-CoA mutase family protein [Methylosinus sp. Sm6]|uniref:methylmalonyl-CoA mutase family protein n=1 Tax=Methylosinus sp. Sm6 TaxID=2866948 RepID=UPI001C99150A|nr:methylmalonyl-CoA mutase family protein [Methylosinus sp. Sm6]MBY6241651.1 methylmalonyl-CoA mutase [Methylosinus sp. Sm6]
MTLHDAPLAGVFPQGKEEDWRKIVDRALKGAPFEKLISKTYDGIAISPLYSRTAAPGPRALRAAPGRWSILARVDHGEAAAANRLALDDLEGGADGLHIVFAGAQGAYGSGVLDDSDEGVAHLFDAVHFDYGVPALIEFSPRATNAVDAVRRLLDRAHIEPSITRVAFGFDPLGAQALHGFLPGPWAEHSGAFARSVRSVAEAGFRFGAAFADARVIHAAGGSEAQELGFALAAALAYLRALEAGGLPLDAARALLAFRLAADADQFVTIAKLRALRRLFARVEEACGLSPAPIYIHAETAWRMATRRDPWTNLLRATLAAFGAAIGGADAVTVLPFTQALGTPDEFARRLARDTQLVLQDESHVHVVDDPSAGAGGMEALTEALCERGWSEFQKIEAEGGLAAALEKGALQGRVADLSGERARNVARSRDKITGSNEFPDIGEAPVATLAPFDAARLAAPAPDGAVRSAPLRPRRLAEPFEGLRERSDAALAETGARPRVFLANLGSVAAYTARANFAKNFFEAGGVEAVFGEDDSDIAALFRASGARLACLCSSDAIYAERAEEAARALAGAGARVYLAGRPGELEARLRSAGIAEFIYAGGDMFETLQRAFEEAG